MHVLSDANGLPLLVGISVGNVHDSEGLKPMIAGHQSRHNPHRGHYFKPQRLHADTAYDRADLRRWLRWKRIGVRIARKGIESSEHLQRCFTRMMPRQVLTTSSSRAIAATPVQASAQEVTRSVAILNKLTQAMMERPCLRGRFLPLFRPCMHGCGCFRFRARSGWIPR